MSGPEGSRTPQVPPPPEGPDATATVRPVGPLPGPPEGRRGGRRGPWDNEPGSGAEAEGAFRVPWGWPAAIGVVVLAQLVAVAALAILAALAPEAIEAAQAPLSGLTFALATVGWVAVRHRGQVQRLLGPGWPGGGAVMVRQVGRGMGAGVAGFAVVVLGFGSLLQIVADRMGMELPPVQQQLDELARNPETLPYLAVAVVAMAPVGEELFFRGLLFQGLRRRVSLWPAIGISGLAFAVVHLEPLAMLIVFPLGMWFAYLFHRSGSLLVPIAAHAAFNSITLAAMVLAPQLPEAGA